MSRHETDRPNQPFFVDRRPHACTRQNDARTAWTSAVFNSVLCMTCRLVDVCILQLLSSHDPYKVTIDIPCVFYIVQFGESYVAFFFSFLFLLGRGGTASDLVSGFRSQTVDVEPATHGPAARQAFCWKPNKLLRILIESNCSCHWLIDSPQVTVAVILSMVSFFV